MEEGKTNFFEAPETV